MRYARMLAFSLLVLACAGMAAWPAVAWQATLLLEYLIWEVWTWDGTTWTELRLAANPPPERSNWTMAHDAARNQVVRVGTPTGIGIRDVSGTWTWDESRWTEHRGMQPRPVLYQQMVSDSLRRQILVFLGEDVWARDGSRWTILGTVRPVPCADAAAGWCSTVAAIRSVASSGWSPSGNPCSSQTLRPSQRVPTPG